jgi:O-antigen/teichoic acid export membrane protein
MASFAAKTGISIIWHFIEVLLSKGVHIITTLLLAWFLVPEDYALVAKLALFIAF